MKDTRARKPLSPREAEQLDKACQTSLEKLVVWALLDLGLRLEELCDLNRRDLLLESHQLRVGTSKTAGNGRAKAPANRPAVEDRGSAATPRRKSGSRLVRLSERVEKLLNHHFQLEPGFPVQKRKVQQIVLEVGGRAGISRDVSPQVLRNTCAAIALASGVHPTLVQRSLGHRRIETTVTYLPESHLEPNSKSVPDDGEGKWAPSAIGLCASLLGNASDPGKSA